MKNKAGTIYVAVISAVSLIALIYVYTVPMNSMLVDGDGVPHLTPPVINPDTGDSVSLGRLIRHYRGD
jgi:hypothetical protein